MDWSNIIEPLVKIIVVFAVLNPTILYLVLLERWVAAWIQDRVGPNRIGPLGLGHAVVDAVKLLFKEDVIPSGVDKALFLLSPIIILIPALCAIAVVPFADEVSFFGWQGRLQIATVDIGILYVLSVTSLGVYGIVLAGWASNSKYAFLGGIRSAAQLISYEVPLGLSILSIVLVTGSLDLNAIVSEQAHAWVGFVPAWNILIQPMGFLVFLTCAFAETNRAPFDVAEAEQELVAGYHTEYSSMKWVMFFLAEYSNMILSSAVISCLFLGGWYLPYIAEPTGSPNALLGDGLLAALVKVGVMSAKIFVLLFVFMWVRWTLPRFRFDQIMSLAWKVLVPLALANFVAVAGALAAFRPLEPLPAWMPSRVQWAVLGLNVLMLLMVFYVLPVLSRRRPTPQQPVLQPLPAGAPGSAPAGQIA